MKKNIFIVASGTGGHVIPAKNIARLLIDSHYTVTWIGTKHGIENQIVNDKRICFEFLDSSGIRGKSIFYKIKGAINLFRSILQSLVHIKKGKQIFHTLVAVFFLLHAASLSPEVVSTLLCEKVEVHEGCTDLRNQCE